MAMFTNYLSRKIKRNCLCRRLKLQFIKYPRLLNAIKCTWITKRCKQHWWCIPASGVSFLYDSTQYISFKALTEYLVLILDNLSRFVETSKVFVLTSYSLNFSSQNKVLGIVSMIHSSVLTMKACTSDIFKCHFRNMLNSVLLWWKVSVGFVSSDTRKSLTLGTYAAIPCPTYTYTSDKNSHEKFVCLTHFIREQPIQ